MDLKIYNRKDVTAPIIGERMLSIYFKSAEANLSARAIKELGVDQNTRIMLASDTNAWYIALVEDRNGYKLTRSSKALGFRARTIIREMSIFYKTKDILRLLIAKNPINNNGFDWYQLIPIG